MFPGGITAHSMTIPPVHLFPLLEQLNGPWVLIDVLLPRFFGRSSTPSPSSP